MHDKCWRVACFEGAEPVCSLLHCKGQAVECGCRSRTGAGQRPCALLCSVGALEAGRCILESCAAGGERLCVGMVFLLPVELVLSHPHFLQILLTQPWA